MAAGSLAVAQDSPYFAEGKPWEAHVHLMLGDAGWLPVGHYAGIAEHLHVEESVVEDTVVDLVRRGLAYYGTSPSAELLVVAVGCDIETWRPEDETLAESWDTLCPRADQARFRPNAQ